MTTATATVNKQEQSPDLDAIEEDARRRIGELTEARGRLSLDAIGDEAARQELANVESELAAAEGELQRVELARTEFGRREQEAQHQVEEKRQRAAQRRADTLERELAKDAAAVDEGAQLFATALAAFIAREGELQRELRLAGNGPSVVHTSSSRFEAALKNALGNAGVPGAIDLPPTPGVPGPLAPTAKKRNSHTHTIRKA
jgi:hypothetical protein